MIDVEEINHLVATRPDRIEALRKSNGGLPAIKL